MTTPQSNEELFDFSKYLVKDSELSQQLEPLNLESKLEDNQQEEPFDFSKYAVKQPETVLEKTARGAIRTGSRIAETIAGYPGDFAQFAKYTGEKLPKVPSFLEREPNILQKGLIKAVESLPTSGELKQVSEKLTGGYTKPKTSVEEFGDQVSSLATILVNPSKAMQSLGSLAKNLGSSVLKAVTTKSVGKGAELLGASDPTKNKIELGTLFMLGLLEPKNAEAYAKDKIKKATSLIPEEQMIKTSSLAKNLEKLERDLSKGVGTPTKEQVLKPLRELKAKASGGAMEMKEIDTAYRNLNEIINSKKLFDELSTTERKLLRHRFDLLKDVLRKPFKEYGKSNPEFYKEWTGGNEAFSTVAQSKSASNFIKSKMGSIPKHLAGSLAIDLFTGHPGAIPATVGAYSAVKGIELLQRVAKSPVLRDHYQKVIMEAANNNFRGMVHNLEKLDKELKKTENKSNTRNQQK